jgi:hypothetical protein
MPIEWAIIFLSTIAACVYFSYDAGMRKGVEEATLLTLSHLEGQGLIHFDNRGNIKSGKGKKVLGDLLDESDGE